MARRIDIVAEARDWIDPITPYHHQAGMKHVGADCIGLVRGVGIECGVWPRDFMSIPGVREYEGYAPSPANHVLERACDRFFTRIPVASIQPADILLMRFVGDPQHLAIVADYAGGLLSIVHAYSTLGKVTEHRLDDIWLRRVVAAYSFPGIEE